MFQFEEHDKDVEQDGSPVATYSVTAHENRIVFMTGDPRDLDEICLLMREVAGLVSALIKVRDTAKAWEGRTDTVPYWNLGYIAAAALVKCEKKGVNINRLVAAA